MFHATTTLTLTGAQGPQGDKGADGAQGPQGLKGADGAQGPQGDKGADGAQGPQGLKGADGAQGPQGLKGADGAQGPQGPQGLKGDTGAQGPQGPAGPVTAPSGRGGSIRTFTGPVGTSGITVFYRVPEGKTFVITDIIAINQFGQPGFINIGDGVYGNAFVPACAMKPNSPACTTSFQAGLRIEAGERIQGQQIPDLAGLVWVTISGYEF
ncbi:collagen-like protein [Corallococcus exiguus]|uniref:collagen-like protein n=1 Tax=Corallococcus exiguus TaxID=83462 RepID=UPI001494EDF5|nr:collagen-like protein [Corallococcus exiguus]NPC74226.1 collagen-like protein [Corallococcus exiguus]